MMMCAYNAKLMPMKGPFQFQAQVCQTFNISIDNSLNQTREVVPHMVENLTKCSRKI